MWKKTQVAKKNFFSSILVRKSEFTISDTLSLIFFRRNLWETFSGKTSLAVSISWWPEHNCWISSARFFQSGIMHSLWKPYSALMPYVICLKNFQLNYYHLLVGTQLKLWPICPFVLYQTVPWFNDNCESVSQKFLKVFRISNFVDGFVDSISRIFPPDCSDDSFYRYFAPYFTLKIKQKSNWFYQIYNKKAFSN